MGEKATALAQYVTENQKLREEVLRLSAHLKSITQLHLVAVDGWHDAHAISEIQAQTILRLRDELAQREEETLSLRAQVNELQAAAHRREQSSQLERYWGNITHNLEGCRDAG